MGKNGEWPTMVSEAEARELPTRACEKEIAVAPCREEGN